MADTKISALPASSGLVAADLIVVVDDPAGTPASQKATMAQVNDFVKANAHKGAISYTIDGGGSAIATGLVKAGLPIPYSCTLDEWTLIADTSGAIVIDVWKDTYANYPPTNADAMPGAGKEPTITATGVKAQDTDLTDWTSRTITAGDILYFNVDSCTSITNCTLTFKITKT